MPYPSDDFRYHRRPAKYDPQLVS
ncbi:hypothetical protein BOS5A_180127 [Bosea sp. EC-HK365B]|nr:hypothetical protein BOSE21B_80034 [Bosea sp. 21B]VVT57247.1 hypothetical protein BOS5A_180127 [Bosea sp. EC-HK365B]VXB51810.1 hypothetical protein BOSE127_120237 [Bosea sp. 127]